MKLSLIVWATACIAVVSAIHKDVHTADKVYLKRQKDIYQLFWHIDQPTTINPEFYQIARSWNLEDHLDAYPGHEYVIHDFVHRWKFGLLPRDAVFSSLHPEHVEELQFLFKLFYYAKDYETFYNTALWARFHVNPRLYSYALAAAVVHRTDTKYIQLPPLYEMYPHLFYNTEVIQAAYLAKIGDANTKKFIDSKYQDGTEVIIHANYSGWYLVHEDAEEKLNYFTEDVGLNSFYSYSHLEFPFWLNSQNYSLPKEIRGEVYYFSHKQLLNRYYLERLSNDMGEIETIDWNEPIRVGYYPTMNLPNGLPITQRPSGLHVPHHMHNLVDYIYQIESRINQIVDSGYVLDNSRPPKFIDVFTPEGINILGNIIQGNLDSYNHQFYGSYEQLARRILGYTVEPIDKNHVVPSALDSTTTSLRDPAFYRIYKKIISFFHYYKKHLPKYTHEELIFPGVKVNSVVVDKLITYFENFDAHIEDGLAVSSMADAIHDFVKVRQYRLNHKPFTYHIDVTSEKDVKGTVRIFMGPKYDVHGHEIDFVDNWANFIEVDQFLVDLKTGANKITRDSTQSIYVVPDQVSGRAYWNKITAGLEKDEVFQYNGQLYGFPERLLLPKGKREGLPLKMFVYVTPFHEDQAVTVESPIWGTTVVDGKPLGYPLDRPVIRHVFHGVPNAYFKDVVVFHKNLEELNQTV